MKVIIIVPDSYRPQDEDCFSDGTSDALHALLLLFIFCAYGKFIIIMPKRKAHVEGFFDLSATEVQIEPQSQRERVAALQRLGYGTVALCNRLVPPLKDTDRCVMGGLQSVLGQRFR